MKGLKADRVWIDEWKDFAPDLIGQPTTGDPKGQDVEQQVEKDRVSQLPS